MALDEIIQNLFLEFFVLVLFELGFQPLTDNALQFLQRGAFTVILGELVIETRVELSV